jgi:hypothetical protein
MSVPRLMASHGARRGNYRFLENRKLRPPRGGGTYHKRGMGASAPII